MYTANCGPTGTHVHGYRSGQLEAVLPWKQFTSKDRNTTSRWKVI